MGPTPTKNLTLAAWLAGSVLASCALAAAQDTTIATPQDVIMARKTLMSTLSDSFDRIEAMIAAGKVDLMDGKDRADTVSVMFMVFPHLFPASSNQWKPGVDLDPATDTFAAPEVWSKYADFYQRSAAASKFAYTMSRAENEDDFKTAAKELRGACNGCHEVYLKQ